jgi:hypothetical protein
MDYLTELLNLVKKLEWFGDDGGAGEGGGKCLFCRNEGRYGHKKNCEMGKALNRTPNVSRKGFENRR